MKCPDIKIHADKVTIQTLAVSLGENLAHFVFDKNNGNPLEKTSEGKTSILFNKLNKKFNYKEAALVKAWILTDSFQRDINNSTTQIKEPVYHEDQNGEVYFKTNKGKVYVDETYLGSEEFLNTLGITNNKNIRNNSMAAKLMEQGTAKMSYILQESLTNLFPGLSVHVLSDEGIHALTNLEDVEGFVGENGEIYLNENMINAESGIHELGHVLKPLLKRYNIHSYNQIMGRIFNDYKDPNTAIGNLANLIKEKYTRKGIDLKDQELVDEVFSDLLALHEDLHLDKLYADANKMKDKTLYGKLKSFVKHIVNTVKEMWNDLIGVYPDSISDLFYKLNQDILERRGKFFSEQNKAYLRNYFADTGYHYKIIDNAKTKANIPIKTASNFHDILIGEDYEMYDENKRADNIIASLKENQDKKSKYYKYHTQGKVVEILKSLNDQDLKTEVIKYIVRPLIELKQNQKTKIVESIKGRKKITDLKLALNSIGGEKTLEKSKEDFIEYTGLNSGFQAVYTLDELKNSSNPVLRSLYHKSFEGLNPMIVVHSISEDGTVDLSVIDFTYDQINPVKMLLNGNNIFSSFLSDEDYFNRTGDLHYINDTKLRNTDVDIKNLQLGLFLLHANNITKGKLKIRNLGTLSVNKGGTSGKMILDINGLINNITIMKSIPELFNAIEDPYLADLVKKSSEYNNEITQSFIAILETYVKEVANRNISDAYLTPGMANVMMGYFKGEKTEKEFLGLIDTMTYHINNKTDHPELSKLYTALTNASREIRTHEIGMSDAVKSFTALNNVLMTANAVTDPYVQDVVEAVKKTKYIIVNKIMNDMKPFWGPKKNGILYKVVENGHKLNPTSRISQYFIDKGSALFEHLYKKKKVRILTDGKLGEEVEVPYPAIHYTLDDAETKELYDKGLLNDDDLKFANMILEKQRDIMIEKIYHQKMLEKAQYAIFGANKIGVKQKTEFTREDAAKIYDTNFNKGDVVFITKSTSELFFGGKFKEASHKFSKGLEMVDDTFEDVITMTDGKYDEVANYFGSQRTPEDRLKQVGLVYDNGNLILANASLNEMMSTNLWSTFVAMDEAITRKIEYEKNVLPVARDSVSLLMQMQHLGKSTDNTIRYIKEYIDANAFRKNQDDDKPIEIIPGVKTRWSTVVRTLAKGYSLAVLPFKLSVGAFSAIVNLNSIFTNSLSAKISGSNEFISPTESFHNALKMLLFNPKKFKAFKRLALQTQIWGREERDLNNSPFLNPTKRKIYEEEFTNIFNYATDTFARTWTMVAALIDDGSIDAYGYDEESGEFTYDEKKDLKFYDEDGKLKPEMEAEYKRVKEALKEEGYDVSKGLPIGIDAKEADRLKYISDKYVIGSFTPESKMQLGNRWLGLLFSSFRWFSGDRLNNLGVGVHSNYKTKIGQKHHAQKMPDGTIVSVRDKIELESMHKSFVEMLRTIFKDGNTSPEQFSAWYNEQPDTRKFNLAKTMIQVLMMSLLAAAYGAMDDDDDDYDKSKGNYWIQKFMGDILIVSTIADVARSPFPVIDAIFRFVQSGDLSLVIPGAGAVKEVYQVSSSEEDK